MELFTQITLFLLGLCIGSFINMLTYRTAVRYKLIKQKNKIRDKNRSYCDFCGKQLHWYENIPVGSWLIQGGKSRCCHRELPVEYPLVELGTGLLFLSYELRVMSYETNKIFWILGLIILTMLIFETIFDLKYMILPDFATIILGVAALWMNLTAANIISGIAAAGFLLALHLLTKGKGMGMGDVKLALFMGILLGWPKIAVAFYAAFISGALAGIYLLIKKKARRNSQIPFGPFLILGTLTAWWWGGETIKFLISNF